MGILLALEGIDGSGKSTQARLLSDALETRGLAAVIFREPGDTEFGDKLREQFQSGRTVSPEEEARLFVEDRRIDVRDNVVPALADGKIVVMDRYYFSTMAYQGALGLDPEVLRGTNEALAPRPDLTLILDVPPSTSLGRIEASREAPDSYEGADYLGRVRDLFLSFCDGDVVRIDASGSEAEVQAAIWELVEELLEERAT